MERRDQPLVRISLRQFLVMTTIFCLLSATSKLGAIVAILLAIVLISQYLGFVLLLRGVREGEVESDSKA